MTEELVTLETAKLLKEKGFNEYCKDIIKAVVADDRGGNSDAIAKYAVNCADALIKRLKENNYE